MRQMWLVLAVLLLTACGADEATSQDVDAEVRATLERAATGEKVTETDTGINPCELLESGIVVEVFAVDAGVVAYAPSFTTHPLCNASWDKPNRAELEEQQPELMMDYMKRRMEAQSKGEPFDEPMPIVRTTNEVTLTVNNSTFDSPEAAVASLEGIIETLSGGMTVEAQGREHTVTMAYEGFLDGVGDRAAWAPKQSQLSAAARGVIFHVGVRVFDEPEENRAHAIEVAKRVADAL